MAIVFKQYFLNRETSQSSLRRFFLQKLQTESAAFKNCLTLKKKYEDQIFFINPNFITECFY